MFKISQRRYLGNKNAILPFIDGIIKSEIGKFNSLCDIFSGTGVVGNYFNNAQNTIISNDLLYHNFVCLNAFLSKDEFDNKKVIGFIEKFNQLETKKENYFSIKNAKKIGYEINNIANMEGM